ncbi:pilus assembly protein [Aquibacillus sp. 3ASR75-11]|uniref:Pilus assembly protein n=1 Tax=Terrihalobacillus insolitus TaxID=2950438 RepID=A0A9X3WWK5_9BACI|nr:TadE/TadG family type IV pilus assembly protein [Terrihalobacillus insolitus]MDC3413649.1 pilus assembly protein [Terrihalobacillus insolitus]MDC3425476.1 pilus assembly protein [Terrihalobacillus insolitus]
MIRNEKGQSLVEMTLIIPVLLFVLLGVFDLGRTLYTYTNLQFTGQETVRIGGLGGTDEEITQFAYDEFNAGDSAMLKVNIDPTQDTRASGDYITVTLSYPIQPITPLIGTFLPDPILLRVDSTIRVE